MSVTINAKGTSVPSFTVGKGGTIISQGGIIAPPSGSDLVIGLDADKSLVIDAGNAGAALITTSENQDLHINPAVGGGQHLLINSTRWPATIGSTGQTLVSNVYGILSWETAGTVTDVSIASANGLAGSVSSASTTPEITLSVSVSGLLVASAGALVAATASDVSALVDDLYVNISGDTMTGALNAPAFNSTSSVNVKENIVDLTPAYLDKFSLLQPREFDRKDYVAHEFGFVAEEMALVYPGIVGRDNAGNPVGIDYSKLTTILTAKIQQQQTEISEMKLQISQMMAMLSMLI